MADKKELVAHDELNKKTAEDSPSESTSQTDLFPPFEIDQPVTQLKNEASGGVEKGRFMLVGPPCTEKQTDTQIVVSNRGAQPVVENGKPAVLDDDLLVRETVVRQPRSPQTVADMIDEAQTTFQEVKLKRPPTFMWLSVLTCFCSPVFAVLAIKFSRASSKAADEGRMDKARHYGENAMALAFIGFFISLVLTVTGYFSVYINTDKLSPIYG